MLQDSSSDRDRLDGARMDILDCIKQTDGYPFDSRASLKKRIQTRTGDSVEYKLAQDIYCLSSVLDGADWDDLRDVLNISRRPSTKKSQSQGAGDVSFQAVKLTEMEQLKSAVHCLTSDMITIKQENIAMKSELNSEIKSLRTDLNQLQADVEADLSELRNLISTNAQSIDRICNERSNGVANLKSDIKLLKTDVKNILDEAIFSVSVTSLDECINKVSAFDKRLNRLTKRIQGEPAQSTATSSKAATVSTEQPVSVPVKQPSQSVTVSDPGLR